MPPKPKKPDYSNSKVSAETCKSISKTFDTVKSDTEKDENGNPVPLYPDMQSIASDYTKILMIQQAVTESLKKGATLLSKSKSPNS